MRHSCIVPIVGLCLGCGPITEVVIRLDAEPGARDRGHFLEAEVVNGEGTIVRDATPAISVRDGDASRFPVTFGLVPEISSRFDFTGRLLDVGRLAFAEVRYEGQYVDGDVTFVDLFFEDQKSSVSAGFAHTCALRDGRLWCFGSNGSGQGGIGTTETPIDSPAPVDGLWSRVSAGEQATCGLDQSGALSCWGESANLVSSVVPVPIEPESRFIDLSVVGNLICTVSNMGLVSCRGEDGDPRLGIDAVTGPPLRTTRVASVRASSRNVCVLTEMGRLHCWGRDPGGTGSFLDSEVALDTRTYVDVAVANGSGGGLSSYGTACAIEQGGALYCMGFNHRGILSDAGVIDEHVPTMTRVGSRSDWLSVSLGRAHACGLHTDGTLECWGANDSGQLGIDESDRDDRVAPTPVQGDRRWASVDCGASFTCGTTQEGAVYCWGNAGNSVLGRDYSSMGRRDIGQPVEVELSS